MSKFDFDDINLVPRKCIVDSRSECDTKIKLGKHIFEMPIVPANMISIMNENLALQLAKGGYFYIMHRFNFDAYSFADLMNYKELPISISVGIKEDDFELIDELCHRSLYPDYITIDVAHGHSDKVIEMIKHIKSYSNSENIDKLFVIAGNVCTPEAVIDLQDAGADAVKVGVGPGHVCTTYMITGFGSRKCQASTIESCAKVANVPIIADGGIVHPGDVAKALALGATMVMSGNLLAGCSDSPGELVYMDDKQYKVFYGSASAYQPGKSNRIEGTKKLVPYNDRPMLKQMEFLKECLQSSISYAGGRDIGIFDTTEYI